MSDEQVGSQSLDVELGASLNVIDTGVGVGSDRFLPRSSSAILPRILFVDQSGQLGGAEFCLLPVAKEVADRAEVLLLADGPFKHRLQEDKVKVSVSYDPAFCRLEKSRLRVSFLMVLPAIIKCVLTISRKARRYDVLYLNSQKALVFGAFGRFIHRKPTIWHVHDIVSNEHFGKVQLLAIRLAVAVGVDTMIANSHASAAAVCKLTGRAKQDVPVIHNGVDLFRFQSAHSALNDRAGRRERLGLPMDKFLVGLFGRLTPWKGQHVAIRSMPLVSGAHLVIVGDALFGEDAYVCELHALVEELRLQDRVSFVCFQDDVPEWMTAMDVIIHTSTAAEPFGLVLIEAMAAKVPLIASRGGAVSEIVCDGETGMTVEPSDPKALAAALEYIKDSPEDALRLADNAYKEVTERFSVALYTQKVIRMLRIATSLEL